MHFGANDTLVIENHYVNIANLNGNGSQTTPNGKGKVIINLWRATSGPVVPASMMFARKTNISLPPNKEIAFSKDCEFLGISPIAGQPLYILGMTGHFHSRGKNFGLIKYKIRMTPKAMSLETQLFRPFTVLQLGASRLLLFMIRRLKSISTKENFFAITLNM